MRQVADAEIAVAAAQPVKNKFGEAVVFVGAENHVHIRVALFYLFADMGFLRHTAAEHHDHVGILFLDFFSINFKISVNLNLKALYEIGLITKSNALTE